MHVSLVRLIVVCLCHHIASSLQLPASYLDHVPDEVADAVVAGFGGDRKVHARQPDACLRLVDPAYAVGGTIILLTPPVSSLLNHLIKVQGGCHQMAVSPTASPAPREVEEVARVQRA